MYLWWNVKQNVVYEPSALQVIFWKDSPNLFPSMVKSWFKNLPKRLTINFLILSHLKTHTHMPIFMFMLILVVKFFVLIPMRIMFLLFILIVMFGVLILMRIMFVLLILLILMIMSFLVILMRGVKKKHCTGSHLDPASQLTFFWSTPSSSLSLGQSRPTTGKA